MEIRILSVVHCACDFLKALFRWISEKLCFVDLGFIFSWGFLKFALIAFSLFFILDWTVSSYEKKSCNCACSCNRRSRRRSGRHCLQSPPTLNDPQPPYVCNLRPTMYPHDTNSLLHPQNGNYLNGNYQHGLYPPGSMQYLMDQNAVQAAYLPSAQQPQSPPYPSAQTSSPRSSPPPPVRRRSQRLLGRTQSSSSY